MIVILSLFSMTFLNRDGFDYPKAWKEVQKAISEGLPKTALKKVEEIYSWAVKENNVAQIVKSTVYRTKLILRTQELGLETIVSDLEKAIEDNPSPTKEILKSYAAEALTGYYQNNLYQINQRTNTASFDASDLRTWSSDHYLEYISKMYLGSVTEELKKYHTRDYNDILETTKEIDYDLRPTLYEVLADKAITYFSASKMPGLKPSFHFVMNDPKYLGTIADFLSLSPSVQNDDSNVFHAFQLFHSLLKYEKLKNNLTALTDFDLKRLIFVHMNAQIPDKDSIYIVTLQKMAEKAPHPYNLEYKLRWAQREDDPDKKHKIYREILKANPTKNQKEEAKNGLLYIEQKSLMIAALQVEAPHDSITIKIDYKNIDKLYMRILRPDFSFSELPFNRETEIKKKLLEIKPLRTWSVTLPLKGYASQQKIETIEGLPVGKYIILTSTNKNFKDCKEDAMIFTPIAISDLAFSTYYDEGATKILVRNRTTGRPVADAIVEIYTSNYNHIKNRNEKVLVHTLTTDRNGEAKYQASQRQSFSIEVKKDGDYLEIPNNNYSGGQYNPPNYYLSKIFTDRAIYRPGQSVHFKILQMQIDKDRVPSIVSGQKMSITLLDVNHQEVETIDVTTNEYGSASGTFVLPTGRLTGNYYIKTPNSSQSIRVEEYKRPKFKVILDDNKAQLSLGDTIHISGKAESFSGSPISKAKVKYSITEKKQYDYWRYYLYNGGEETILKQAEMTTDGNGNFEFDFNTDRKEYEKPSTVFTYTIHVEITDMAGETREETKTIRLSAIPYGYQIDLPPIAEPNDLDSTKILCKTLNGESTNNEAILRIAELQLPEKWERPNPWGNTNPNNIYRRGYPIRPVNKLENYPEKRVVLEKKLTIPKEGLIYDFSKILNAGAYKISIESIEKFRDKSVSRTSYIEIFDFDKKDFPTSSLLYYKSNNQKITPGKKYTLNLGSTEDVTVNYHILHQNTIRKSGYVTLNPTSKISYTPVEEDRGGITLVIDYIKNNRFFSKTINIDVSWEKQLKIELLTKRDKTLPGSKEKWQLKIKGPGGEKVMAELLATMYDKSLDEFAPLQYTFSLYPSGYGSLMATTPGFATGNSFMLNYNWNSIPIKASHHLLPPRLISLGFGHQLFRSNKMYAKAEVSEVMVMDKASDSNFLAGEAVIQESAGPSNPPPSDGDREGKPNQKMDFSPRKNLRETVFFYPHLKTDNDGNVIIEFTMNEALTTWKMLAFAHTKDLKYGFLESEIQTQKDLMIVPNAPRFFREGDRIIFPATVTNMTDHKISATVMLDLKEMESGKAIDDLFGLSQKKKTINIPAGESVRVDWPLLIPKDYKKLVNYTVKAKSGPHTDGEENIIPVLTNQTLVTETKIISVKPHENKTIEFEAMKNNSQTASPFAYTLEYTSNPVWYAIQSLPYLMEYPHQCTEQIMNRLYANVMASHIANKHPRIKEIFDQWKKLDSDALLSNLEKNKELKTALLEETPWVRNALSETQQKKRIALLFDLNKMASETQNYLRQIADRQMPSGGFSWFPGGREDTYITQYVVESIAHLKRLGILDYKTNQWNSILSRALLFLDIETSRRYEKLKKSIDKYGGSLDDDHLDYLSIHYLYVRSFFSNIPFAQNNKKAYNYYMGQAKKYWLGKGIYNEAMLGLILKRSNLPEYRDISKSLKERSFFSEERGRYWNLGNGFNWYELPIESHAMVMEFFVETETINKDFLEDMKIWLLKNKQTNHWKTTKGTAAAIYALLITGENDGMTPYLETTALPVIKVGTSILPVENAEAGTGYIKKSWTKDDISTKMSTITIQNNNPTIGWGAAYYQYFEDLDKVKSFKDTPLKLTRKYYKELTTDKGALLSPVEKEHIQPGDRIISRITLKVDRPMSYVHLKDMRGSGLEPENVLSGYKYAHGLGYYESTRDMASHFFISHLGKGTYVFEIPLRAVHKGDCSTGIATLQCMYAPEFTSHSQGERIIIK